jgi:hypothetical protein
MTLIEWCNNNNVSRSERKQFSDWLGSDAYGHKSNDEWRELWQSFIYRRGAR